MTPKKRAEKILCTIVPVLIYGEIIWKTSDIDFVTSQIEEAYLQGFKEGQNS